MKTIKCYLPNINFTVKVPSEFYDSACNALNESIIRFEKNTEKKIEIEYIVNKMLFQQLVNKINNSNGFIYNSFKNQTHKEVKIEDKLFYLVNSEQYICEKNNDYSFKIIVEENSSVSLNWIIRIIRELYLRQQEDNKYFFMHGTAVEFNNKGILLLGASGSGKTTLAVKLLELESHKNFLSNDRVLIDKNKNLEYFPHAVTYAMGTVKNNEHLDKYFRQNKILEQKRNIKYEDASYDLDCNTPLTDVEKIFNNTGMTAKSLLHLIIFPKFNKEMYNLEIINMTDEEKLELLENTCFTPNDTEALRKPWLRKRKLNETHILNEKKELMQELLSNIKMLKICFGAKSDVKKILDIL